MATTGLEQQQQKRKLPSVFFEHYTDELFTDDGKIEGNCVYCNTRIRGKSGVSSNFLTHLRRKHPTTYEEIIRKKERLGLSACPPHLLPSPPLALSLPPPPPHVPNNSPSSSSSNLPLLPVYTQQQLQQQQQPTTKHAMISAAISKMIVTDLLPLRTVDGKGFRDFMHMIDPSYIVMSEQQLKHNILPQFVHVVQENIRSALKDINSYILTVDVWEVNPHQVYMGFSASFFTPTWQVKTIVLACSYIIGYEGFQRIPLLIQEVGKAYGIQDFLYHVVVNKMSPGFNGLLSTADTDDSEDEDYIDFEVGSTYSKAFSSLLSLSIREGMIKGLSPHWPVLERVTQAVRSIRKCPQMTEKVFSDGLSTMKTEVKWIMHLQLIRCLLKQMMVTCSESNQDIGSIDANSFFVEGDKALLKEMVDILELFEEAVNLLQDDRHLPVSLCIPSYVSLKSHLSAHSSGLCSSLAMSLSTALTKYFKDNTMDSLYVCAAVLDPRFKLTWCNSTFDYEKYVKIVLCEAHKHVELTTTTSSEEQSCSATFSLSKSKLFSPFSTPGNSSSSKWPRQNPELELESYLKDSNCGDDPLLFWKVRSGIYPVLAKLAKRVLSVPATPTPIHSVFSFASTIVQSDPSSFFPEHFEIILFLKANVGKFLFQ